MFVADKGAPMRWAIRPGLWITHRKFKLTLFIGFEKDRAGQIESNGFIHPIGRPNTNIAVMKNAIRQPIRTTNQQGSRLTGDSLVIPLYIDVPHTSFYGTISHHEIFATRIILLSMVR